MARTKHLTVVFIFLSIIAVKFLLPDDLEFGGRGQLEDFGLPDSLPRKSLESNLIDVLKLLRSSSVTDLKAATEIVEDVHKKLGLTKATPPKFILPPNVSVSNDSDVVETHQSKEICPETYKGGLHGYPFFDFGWVRENCTYEKHIRDLVTIVFDFTKQSNAIYSQVALMVSTIQEVYPGVNMIAAVNKSLRPDFKESSEVNQSKVSFVSFPSNIKPGKIFNSLTASVKTPYTYIARDVFFMDEDSRLERLVRQITDLKVAAIGSSKKDKDGIWSMNCFQTTHRHYTLTYTTGYYHSQNACVFCNFTEGPFLARTEFIKQHRFDENLEGPLVFREYFFKLDSLQRNLAVCPDSMQHVDIDSVSDSKAWLPFAKKNQLNKIVCENGSSHEFSCEELQTKCSDVKGRIHSPCCLKQLKDVILFTIGAFRDHSIQYEIQDGTLVGFVKFGGVLPWERDADFAFLSSNFTAVANLKAHFKHHGYRLNIEKKATCCNEDGLHSGGVMTLHASKWYVELWGMPRIGSDLTKKRKATLTKILVHGEPVVVPRNPALFVRNRYGYEIFKHAQHWTVLGKKSGFDDYHPGSFTKCDKPGNHYCLDLFPADGNIQFLNLID